MGWNVYISEKKAARSSSLKLQVHEHWGICNTRNCRTGIECESATHRSIPCQRLLAGAPKTPPLGPHTRWNTGARTRNVILFTKGHPFALAFLFHNDFATDAKYIYKSARKFPARKRPAIPKQLGCTQKRQTYVLPRKAETTALLAVKHDDMKRRWHWKCVQFRRENASAGWSSISETNHYNRHASFYRLAISIRPRKCSDRLLLLF